MAQDLIFTEKLKKETVIGMLTRTAAHYPNSGHTIETLSVVAEDWYETFKDRLTDQAFIGAISQARRQSAFFPTEKNVFDAAGGSLVRACAWKRPPTPSCCPRLDFSRQNSYCKDGP